jgi:YHS domain-containing protein
MNFLRITLGVVALFVSASVWADGSKVALGGYCPVAYFKSDEAVFGDPDYASEFEGRIYYFAGRGAKKLFDKDPASYINPIQYNSYCATGIAMGQKILADPKIFSLIDGKVYLFSDAKAKSMFDADAKNLIAKANKAWAKLK